MADFAYHPPDLKLRFQRIRARRTCVVEKEHREPAFQRLKRWLKEGDWKGMKKRSVFGLTTSTSQKLCFLVPQVWSSEQ